MKKELKRNFKKKLNLNKSTIANLLNYQMKKIYGGTYATYWCKKATYNPYGGDC